MNRRKVIASAVKQYREDDPRWMRQHGPGQERKVGGNVTVPRAYATRSRSSGTWPSGT